MTGIWKNLIEKIQDNNGVIFQHDILPSMLFWLITLYSVYMCIYCQLKWPKVCRPLTSESHWTVLVQCCRSHPLVKQIAPISEDASQFRSFMAPLPWHVVLERARLSGGGIPSPAHPDGRTIFNLVWHDWERHEENFFNFNIFHGSPRPESGGGRIRCPCAKDSSLVNNLQHHHFPTHVRQRQVEDELLICKIL